MTALTHKSIAAIVLIMGVPIVGTSQTTSTKRLIEFGWDQPSPSFMRKHIVEMEKAPFDGCVYGVECSGGGWGSRRFDMSDVKGSYDDLRATSFTKFRHNFVRFNVTPGTINWFDDFTTVTSNARLVAQVANFDACDGVLFDIETYARHIFNYNIQPSTSTISWDAYAHQVRQRGREVMSAFQEGYPDLTIMTTYAYSLPRVEMDANKAPLKEVKYGLLAPFLDGMLDAARGRTKIVDGYEVAYGYRQLVEFQGGRKQMKEDLLPIVADPETYAKRVSAGFGLWLDYNWRKIPYDPEKPETNYRTPALFGQCVSWALEHSDEYVWIYTEVPRWWSDAGSPVKLPQAYADAISAAVAANQKRGH